MKVILLENVDTVGLPGQVADVKAGYYRNFLQPRGMALEATASNLKSIEARRAKLHVEAERIVKESSELGDQIKEVTLTFVRKVSETGKLFGSVGVADIVAGLAEEGFEVERRKVALSEAVKAPGTFTATVKLHADLSVPLTFIVEPEDAGGELTAEEALAQEEEREQAEEQAKAAEAEEGTADEPADEKPEDAKDEKTDSAAEGDSA